MVRPVVKLDGSSRLTHSVTTPYLLSRFGFQETAPIADECDGRRLTVASCSTSHSCTIKDKVTALARPDDSTGLLRSGHTIPASPSALCRCRGLCRRHSSTGRRRTGFHRLTTAVLTVPSGPSGQPHFGFPNSRGRLRSPALTLSPRHSCSPEGLCLRRDDGKQAHNKHTLYTEVSSFNPPAGGVVKHCWKRKQICVVFSSQ